MPILNQIQVTNAYVKVRYKEPYVSDALNKKTFGVFPKGIYAGFSLSPGNLGTRDILVGSDYVAGGLGSGLVSGYSSGAYDETLGFSVAVFQSTEGVNTTVQIPPPLNSYHLDATGLEGQRVYAVINVSYVVGQITTLHLMLVDSTMLDQDPSLIVIGHVDVPASPSTPLDSSMFGYDDPQYPRLTPLSTPVRAGLMPKETWGQIGEIHELTDLAIVQARSPVDVIVDVTPATGELLDGTKIRLPIGTQVVEYAGGTINFETGVVTGGGDNFTGAATLLSNGQEVYYSVQILKGNPNTLLILPGTPATIGSGAYAPFADGTIPRAQVLVKKTGGFVQDISQSDVTLILSSGSGSGAGAGGSDLLRAVWENESSSYTVPQPNQFLDNFNTDDKGTFVNCGVTGGLLKPSGVNTSYSYERTKETTSTCVSAEGTSFMSIIAVAPNNTAIASNTIKFDGDVTAYFAVSKAVTILREFTNDGQIDHKHLTQPNPTIVARLTVSSLSFAAGVTTMVVSNPKNLDITMGVSAGNQNSELRVCPADYQLQASVTGTYQDMNLVDAHIIRTIRIPGQSTGFLTLPGTISGSIEWSDMHRSPSGDYVLITALEKTSGNSTWHFWYSTSGGMAGTFTKFATTESFGDTTTEEFSGLAWKGNRAQVLVADNGRAIIGLTKATSGLDRFCAFYTDLSAGTPAITEMPQTGVDAANDLGTTDSVIFSNASNDSAGTVAIDSADCSLIAFAGGYVNGASTILGYVRFYSWTGATPTHDGLSSSSVDSFIVTQSWFACTISGTSPNRRITVFYNNSPSANLEQHYWDEGNLTEQGDAILTTGVDCRMYDIVHSGDIVYVFVVQNSPDLGKLSFVRGDLSTQVYSSLREFDDSFYESVDTYNGYGVTPSDIGQVLSRTARQRAIVDPSNSDHILVCADLRSASTFSCRTTVLECTDAPNFLGAFISVPQSGSLNFRETSSDQQYAQLITPTAGQHLNTLKILMRQVGTLPSNAEMYVELQGVSAGAPDGVVLATSQTLDATKVTKDANGAIYYFNFPEYTFASAQYSLVLKTNNIPVSATNYIVLATNSTAPYVGGNLLSYNGSSWSDTTHDLCFEVSGNYIYIAGDGLDETVDQFGSRGENQESSFGMINASTALLAYRKAYIETSANARYLTSGFTRTKTLTLSTGNAQSTLSSENIAGYAPGNVDSNLVLNVSMGDSACDGKNVETGLSDAQPGNDRSGWSHVGVESTSPSDYVSDPDFESGFCLDNPGTTSGWGYGGSSLQAGNIGGRKFCIEGEIKVSSLAAVNYIIVKHSSGTPNGWLFLVNTDGTLNFNAFKVGPTSVQTISNETFAVGQHYWVKVTGDGSTVRLYYKTGDSTAAYTECTYSAQVTDYNVNNFLDSSYGFTIGTVPLGTGQPNCRYGIVRVCIGSDTFAYEGFKDQASLGAAKNIGTRILTERRIGHFDDSIGGAGSHFDELALIDPNANELALVNSYDQLWQWSAQFNTGGSTLKGKVLGNRASSTDPSGIPAVGWQFFNG